jgi:hypothetical protein
MLQLLDQPFVPFLVVRLVPQDDIAFAIESRRMKSAGESPP